MGHCSVCRTLVKMGDSLQHDECGHWTHSECLDSLPHEPDFELCPACLGQIDTTLPLLPEKEPRPDETMDYVTTMERPLLWRNPDQDTLLSLLQDQTPVDEMMRNHGYGLQHFLKNQVTIDDFLAAGYGIEELMLYQDMQNRPIATLKALGMTIDHVREYPEQLPWQKLQKECKLEPKHLCTEFYLNCPDGGYVLASPTSEEWTAKDVLKLGLTLNDLCKYGNLQYVEQYEALEPTAEEEMKLGTTVEKLIQLKRFGEEKLERKPEKRKIVDEPIRIRRTRHGLKQ